MPLTFNGNVPGNITYNGEFVKTVTFNGEVVWVSEIVVTYAGACGNQRIDAEPTFTLSTSNASPMHLEGTYTYTLKIPYKKTTSQSINNSAYLRPTLKDSSGNTIREFGSNALSRAGGVDVRYLTLTWTSEAWLGEASDFKLYIDSSGSNRDLYRYPTGYDITLTATNA